MRDGSSQLFLNVYHEHSRGAFRTWEYGFASHLREMVSDIHNTLRHDTWMQLLKVKIVVIVFGEKVTRIRH